MDYIRQNTPEQVDCLPIEVPLSPLANGQLPNFTVECELPGTPTSSDRTLRTIVVESIGSHDTKSASENDVTALGNTLSKEIESSETSSDISAESNSLLLSNKPVANNNSRGSPKRKKRFLSSDRHSDQTDVELKVIHNGSIYDQDSAQTASC